MKNKSDRLSIAQTLSQIEARDQKTLKKLSKSFNKQTFKNTICFTGPAGVGKSTFLSKLALMQEKRSIAWLACDPSSLKTGGGFLGDRVRLSGMNLPDNLFIRSVATRSTQAYSRAIRDMSVYLEELFDEVWIETAGSGQTQQEVAFLAGTTVLILQPQTGDDVQWMKSGVQELADFYIVHKSDLPGAEDIRNALLQNGIEEERISLVSSKKNQGFEEFNNQLKQYRKKINWSQKLLSVHRQHFKEIYIEKLIRDADKKLGSLMKKNLFKPYDLY